MSHPTHFVWIRRGKLTHIYAVRSLRRSAFQLQSLCPRSWDRVVELADLLGGKVRGADHVMPAGDIKGPLPIVDGTCTVCDRHFRNIRRES